MKKNNTKIIYPDEKTTPVEESTSYPATEDIYNTDRKMDDINPGTVSQFLETGASGTEKNNIDFADGSDLDVPGSELDDEQENIGSEDEENNYYSLSDDGAVNPEDE